jgi:hypothetical protein
VAEVADSAAETASILSSLCLICHRLLAFPFVWDNSIKEKKKEIVGSVHPSLPSGISVA